MKRTYPPGTICLVCFNEKADKNKPNKCSVRDRHLWNKEPITVQVETINNNLAGVLPSPAPKAKAQADRQTSG